jgi:hypothetical protein
MGANCKAVISERGFASSTQHCIDSSRGTGNETGIQSPGNEDQPEHVTLGARTSAEPSSYGSAGAGCRGMKDVMSR